ncbi:MAG: alpha/beta hydrolase, partial [Nitrososphaerota archaeon]|nr:alpha/beta hydrolase [Nitrososphaerota archaeon]
MISKEIEDKEITWKVLDGIVVHGTITSPKDNDAHPAVVFLAGSGPTDRNWCSPLIPGANGTAKLLAEELAKLGYVSLRYDKLGSGPHVKENLPKFTGRVSMQTFMEELSAGVETILSEKNVDGSRLFALTSSEGAIHAVNYQLHAKKSQFKGLVLTGAPGRAIGDVSRTQFLGPSRAFPNGEILMKHYDEAISDFLAGRRIVIDPSLPRSIEPFFHALENPTNLPFSRELWTYNLSDYITRIVDPILIIIGKKDIQVDWQLDGNPLETALEHNNQASFAYPENANHVLKHEEMPREKLTPE